MRDVMKPATSKRSAPRVLLITGGANGIGRVLVQRFLAQGCAVATIDPDQRANAELTQDATRAGTAGRLLVIRGDVSREPVVRSAVRTLLRRFGRLDALINNAARTDAATGPIERLSLSTWNRFIGSGLTGAFLCVKHAVPALRRAQGAIINIASTRALQSEPRTEAYAATKGGVVALTHALAISLGPDIRVNCISPGWIATDVRTGSGHRAPQLSRSDHAQHPVGRVGRPQDIADLADYLLSSGATFITGQNLVLDGGMTRKMIYAE